MKLADYLSSTGVTQADFAQRIGVHQSAVTRYVAGHRIPKPQTAMKITKATGGAVTIEDLFDVTAPPEAGAAASSMAETSLDQEAAVCECSTEAAP